MPSSSRLLRVQKGEIIKISSSLGDSLKDRRPHWPTTAKFSTIAKNVDGNGLTPSVKRSIRLGMQAQNQICCSCTGDCSTNPHCECLKMAKALEKACGSELIHSGKYIVNPISDYKYEYYNKPRFVCGPRCSCNQSCSLSALNDMDNHQSAKFKVCRFDSKGFGLYAKKDILAGSPVISFNGEIVGESVVNGDIDVHQYSLQIIAKDDPMSKLFAKCISMKDDYKKPLMQAYRSNTYLNPLTKGNAARFSNHSCDPNMEILRVFQGGISPADLRVVFVATKDIRTGEELTFNYGPSYVKKHLGKNCLCQKCQAV